MRVAASWIVGSLLLCATPARAQLDATHSEEDPPTAAAPPATPPAAPVAPVPRTTRTKWYGRETLIVDGVSAGVFALGVGVAWSAQGEGMLLFPLAGIVSYGIGAPIVHTTHGNVGRAAASLALRVALPTIGTELTSPRPDDSVGLVIGVASAVALDASVFAFETVEETPPARSVRAINLSPVASINPRGSFFGVGGAF